MESSKVAQKKVVKTAAVAIPAVAASAPVAVAVAAPVAAAAPPAKKAAAKKADAAPVAAAPVASKSDAASTVASTVAATEATAETAVVSPHDTLETLANDMIKMAKSLLETARQAKKEHAKVVKKAEQGGKKRRAKSDGESTHSNSVFLQPSKISPALAKFCGVSSDTMLSRTESTRKIAAYIKEHDLQNPENRREIRADATLTALFALTSEDKLNYFNLQRYIKPHFIKEIKPEVAKAEVKA
jgi:upstream activation factor subunit UAF30